MHPSTFRESAVAGGPHIVIPNPEDEREARYRALQRGGKCSKLSSLLRLFDSQLKKGSDGLLRRAAAAVVVVDVAGLRVVVRRGGRKIPEAAKVFYNSSFKVAWLSG